MRRAETLVTLSMYKERQDWSLFSTTSNSKIISLGVGGGGGGLLGLLHVPSQSPGSSKIKHCAVVSQSRSYLAEVLTCVEKCWVSANAHVFVIFVWTATSTDLPT